MMTHALVLLWATAIPLMCSPGPANLSLASFGVAYGFRRSLPYLVGILLGTIAVLVFVALGITAVILSDSGLVNALKALAMIYIVYLAWRIAVAPIAKHSSAIANVPSIVPGLALALANPKAFAAIGAAYTGHGLVEDSVVVDALLKISALSIVIVASGFGWLTFGALFSSVLSHPRIGRLVNVSFALLLVFSATAALMM